MWDRNSLSRGRTHVPCIARQILNHWTTKEVPFSCLSVLFKIQILWLSLWRVWVSSSGWASPCTQLNHLNFFLFFIWLWGEVVVQTHFLPGGIPVSQQHLLKYILPSPNWNPALSHFKSNLFWYLFMCSSVTLDFSSLSWPVLEKSW